MNIHGLENYLHLYFIYISVTSVISVIVVVTVSLDYFYISNVYHLKQNKKYFEYVEDKMKI